MSTAEIILLIVALLLSAFFSGMEIAFVSSSKLRYEVDKADRSISSRLLGIFYRHPDSYISTMLVGNNAVLVIYSILMAKLLNPWLSTLMPGISDSLLLLIDTVLSTIVVIIFGEYIPKTLFRRNANGTLSSLSLPAYLFYILLYPLSLFATWCARGLLRIGGVRIEKENTGKLFTKMDLDDLIESGIGTGDEPASTEVQIFRNALEFSTLRVRDCMVPRNEIAAIDKNDCTPDELLRLFVKTGYSKIIVYEDAIDNIIGYIHSSDLFRTEKTSDSGLQTTEIPDSSFLITNYLQSLPIVPETANAQKLMTTLMQQKKSLAVVVDEFGGTAGIVSLEDILEELTGDIEDEHDTTRLIARAVGNDTYVLSARLEIEKVNGLFGLDLPVSDDYYTVGGLILHYHRSIPVVGDKISLPGGLEFTILKAAPGKILQVRLHIV
jgi:CBS domain containing-hemolysin-like protein